MLDEILAKLDKMSPEQLTKLEKAANQVMPNQVWYPHPENKPQCQAYYSKADITLFGGSPGGGKTGLLLGTALTAHKRGLIVRKQFTDLEGVVDNLAGMLKSDKGIVRGNRPKYKGDNGQVIYFQGMGTSGDIDTGKQGNAFDFIGIDEGAQLAENDVRLLIGWNRTTDENQRCRIIIASNPPTSPVGDWLGTFFAPWFDPKHEKPAKFGELRWFYFDDDGKSVETEHKEPFELNGKKYYPQSRTYVFSAVENNPYIDSEEYKKNLQTLPEPFRTQLLSGNFLAARKDQDYQVIPTSWVIAAFERWEENQAKSLSPMTCIGADCAGGGTDNAVIAPLHQFRFSELIKFKTIKDEYGSQTAAEIIKIRRHNAVVTLDMGGGFGSGTFIILKDNIGLENIVSYRGGSGPTARTQDGKLQFSNARTQAYWQFREALNPDQDGGSQVELPRDARLLAGLTAPTFEIRGVKIHAETKEDVKDKLNYSPDEADAVVMCWFGRRIDYVMHNALKNFSYQMKGQASSLPRKMVDKYAERRVL